MFVHKACRWEEVINTAKACTKKKSADFEDISIDIVAKVIGLISVIVYFELGCFHQE